MFEKELEKAGNKRALDSDEEEEEASDAAEESEEESDGDMGMGLFD